jgi:hypothetical protein
MNVPDFELVVGDRTRIAYGSMDKAFEIGTAQALGLEMVLKTVPSAGSPHSITVAYSLERQGAYISSRHPAVALIFIACTLGDAAAVANALGTTLGDAD